MSRLFFTNDHILRRGLFFSGRARLFLTLRMPEPRIRVKRPGGREKMTRMHSVVTGQDRTTKTSRQRPSPHLVTLVCEMGSARGERRSSSLQPPGISPMIDPPRPRFLRFESDRDMPSRPTRPTSPPAHSSGRRPRMDKSSPASRSSVIGCASYIASCQSNRQNWLQAVDSVKILPQISSLLP